MSDIIVVGIPGYWKDRSEIVQSIVRSSGGYIYAGGIIKKIDADEVFELEIYEHDPNLVDAFRIALQGKYTEDQLDHIGEHTLILYVIGQSGSLDDVRRMTSVTKALLNLGGIAAKVENSGTARMKSEWLTVDADNGYELFNCYITYGRADGFYYSCGMHVFGLPDTIVESHHNPEQAASLMTVFLQYCLFEQPEIKHDQTFNVDKDSPIYRIEKMDCVLFEDDTLLHNPYGVWRLSAI